MKPYIYAVTASITLLISSCGTKPHKKTEKIYNEQLTTLKQTISSKEPEKLPTVTKTIISIDTSYSKVLYKFSDTIAQTGARSLENGKKTEWIGTVNFNLRKPNLVIIHHTAQNALEQTIQTFTMTKTKVSSHYIIGKDGK
ncbi:MAG: N-acetylmuramoyl-L-alanine amidase, partial [Bacteroidota bacterium]|nr:N-acetylmuramoyl-L-alanine amidase [Bacteroidota bacterium]